MTCRQGFYLFAAASAFFFCICTVRAGTLHTFASANMWPPLRQTDLSRHFGAGVLLASCLGEKLAFVERTRRLIREIAETRILERMHAHA